MILDVVLGSALVVALGELIKTTGLISKRLIPVVLLVLSVVGFYFLGQGETGDKILSGIMAALMGMGFYSGTKTTVM